MGVASTSQQNEESEESLSRDDCYELLSNHRRRYVLYYLRNNGDGAELGNMAEIMAAWENDVPREEVTYDQRKRVYTSLQQVHLPRMDDMGVVRYDDREGMVQMGAAVEDLDIYLEVVEDDDIPWSAFYLGLALFNAAVVSLAALSVPLVSAIPSLGIAVFVVTTFLVTSLAHLYLTKTEMELGAGEKPPELE